MPTVQLVATVRAHEQQRYVPELAREMREELERSLVRPMQVLDDDHDRSLTCQIRQEGCEGGIEAIAIDPHRRRIGRCDGERGHAVRGPRDVHERSERTACVDLRAFARQDARTFGACRLSEVPEYSCLVYSGLARD